MSPRRVLVTRPDAGDMCERLRALGWEPYAIPTVALEPIAPGGPLDDAVRRLDDYDWVVVTSAAGVRALFGRLRALGLSRPSRPRWASVGPATAAALRAEGVEVAVVPDRYLTTAIPDGLGDVTGRRVLLPRADAASPDLPRMLRERGAVADEVTAYRTIEGPESSRKPLGRLLAAGIGAVIFTSGSTVRGFTRLAGAGALAPEVLVVCIGPVTAEAARSAGLRPAVVAEEHTTDGVVAALTRAARRPGAARAEGGRR